MVWRQEGKIAAAASEVAGAVRGVLASAGSLDAWARSRDPRATAGRGTVRRAVLGDRPVAVRHAWRGGWMRFLGDRYFGRPPRPFVELAVSERLRAAGVATPRVLAALVHPGRLGYRADLVTEWLGPGHDLRALLAPNAYPHEARTAGLVAAGRVVGRAHAAGLDHPDLNAGNLFLETAEGGKGWSASILDLDRASIGSPSGRTARSNLARLVRSLEKERRLGRIAWDGDDLAAFTRAHAAAAAALRDDA